MKTRNGMIALAMIAALPAAAAEPQNYWCLKGDFSAADAFVLDDGTYTGWNDGNVLCLVGSNDYLPENLRDCERKVDGKLSYNGTVPLKMHGLCTRTGWRHSPESWSYNIEKYPSGEVIGREVTVGSLLEEVLKDKDFYDAYGGGVTVSGGEPLAHPDFLRDFFREAKKAGLHTAIETSGFASSAVIDGLLPHVDLWLYDIKLLDPEACMKLTARPLAPVLGNLRRINAKLASAGKGGIVLRCPMIPGLNDGVEELRGRGALADELDAVERLDVIPYVPYGIDKAKRLGLKVYEAPRPPVGYGEEKVRELARYTRKRVCVG